MRLDPYARDFAPYTSELDEALAEPTTRIYLDTSMLMWLIRIGRDARAEFIAWCKDRPAGTVRVPVWAAHELHRHLIRNTIPNNVGKLLAETESKINEFAALVSERADDATCQNRGYPGRDAFISTLEQTVARVKSISTVVKFEQPIAVAPAADAVVAFVNEHILDTNLDPIMAALSGSGDFRFSHLVPPGYLDRKEENRFGDLVIWEEMIADLPKSEAGPKPHAVLLSRDEKTDWVSSAPAIREDDPDKPSKSNRAFGFDVTLPHPLLAHEFAMRSGAGQLYVVHPGVFAAVLDYGRRKHRRPAAVQKLLAASYRPDFLNRLAIAKLAELDGASDNARARRRESHLFAPPALSDLLGQAVSEPLRAYEAATPPEQDAIAQQWLDDIQAGRMSPALFGRLAAELAQRGRPEWSTGATATLEQLRPALDEAQLNLMVLALITSAYLDPYGEALRQPRAVLASLALQLESEAWLSPAFTCLKAYLADKEVELPYIPASGRAVPYVLDLASGTQARLVRDIRLGDQSVLQQPVRNEARALGTMLDMTADAGPTGKDLRALVARTYHIPFERLDSRFDKQKIAWSPDAGLVVLDTGSPGGLSAADDDGEDG